MQKIPLGNLVVFAILVVCLSNITKSKEKIEEVDLMSVFPFEY
ncbi:hypothetical protein [Bacillus pseudomycoides]|nr:hypothetical protein [Bacillus pseudomycoides]